MCVALRLILTALLAASAFAADEFSILGYNGGKTLNRGKKLWITVDAGFLHWRTVTAINTATETLTVPAHGFPLATYNGLRFRSSLTLPSPFPRMLKLYTVAATITPDTIR